MTDSEARRRVALSAFASFAAITTTALVFPGCPTQEPMTAESQAHRPAVQDQDALRKEVVQLRKDMDDLRRLLKEQGAQAAQPRILGVPAVPGAPAVVQLEVAKAIAPVKVAGAAGNWIIYTPSTDPYSRGAAPDAQALVNQAIELRGEIENARLDLVETEKAIRADQATDEARKRARTKMETLSRKREALHTTIDGERRATDSEIKSLKATIAQRQKDGQELGDLEARVIRLETRVRTLQMAQ